MASPPQVFREGAPKNRRERLGRPRDEGVHFFPNGDVAALCDRFRARLPDRFRDRRGAFGIEVTEDDPGAGLREHLGDRLPDARSGTRHDGDPTVEPEDFVHTTHLRTPLS